MTDEELAKIITEVVKRESAAIKAELKKEFVKILTNLTEKAKLNNKIAIKDDLLAINTHINERLNTLKGDKGEKGDAGQSGLLSGVSTWEDGQVAKKGFTFTHKGGLWFCKKETGKSPCLSDEWKLLIDGDKQVKVESGNLIVEKSSGNILDLGRVSVFVAGKFKAGESYNIYDIVTHNKSSWISEKNNNKNHPPSDSWTMLAGKGVRGEQGKQGMKGETGKTIEPDDLIPIVKSIIEAE